MSLPSDDLTRTPPANATITLPGDIPVGRSSILLGPLGPPGYPAPRAVRWQGAGAGVLWFAPLAQRQSLTASEVTKVADGLTFYRSDFSGTWEEQQLGVVAIHTDSTAGAWKVTF
jgi:hypothetical protein